VNAVTTKSEMKASMSTFVRRAVRNMQRTLRVGG
jgi:hypothetical protein